MRDTSLCRWRQWRVTLVKHKDIDPVASRYARRPLVVASDSFPEVTPVGESEELAADGIRHELVARVRREIEAGTYETEEKWLAAEEMLLRRVAEGL